MAMDLDNYSDRSTRGSSLNAGFQFEFYCQRCSQKWRSPFQPYRMGQFSSLLSRFAYLFGGASTAVRTSAGISDVGEKKAWDDALAEATAHARTLYTRCQRCSQAVCGSCLDVASATCRPCLQNAAGGSSTASTSARGASGAHSCPNCGAGSDGGRFCAECGFDMASTHKSCPGCGATVSRQSRFCTDCGHGF